MDPPQNPRKKSDSTKCKQPGSPVAKIFKVIVSDCRANSSTVFCGTRSDGCWLISLTNKKRLMLIATLNLYANYRKPFIINLLEY